MEKKSKWQRFWQWPLYVIALLIVIGVFIWQLDNLEKFFKQYPHAIDGGTSAFVLFTTTLSIIIAYKSYRNNLEQEIRKEQKHSNLLKNLINRKTQKLRTRINTVNLEYTVKHKIEGFDLLYIVMKEKDTKKDISDFRDIIEDVLSENPTGFTEEDTKLISHRIRTLENLSFIVGGYMMSEGDVSNTEPQAVFGGNSTKEYIQKNIDAVTRAL